MIVDIVWTWQELAKHSLERSAVVVADVLRATTVMVTAFANGAKAILPQAEIPTARGLYTTFHEQGIPVLLCGEIEGIKIEGFDLGNSPLEYTTQLVDGKTLIHYTTNGTKALNAVSAAPHAYIASFANRKAVAATLAECFGENLDSIKLIASGKLSNFCLEDTVCMGGIVHALRAVHADWEYSDAALAAESLYKIHHTDLFGLLQHCEHGRYLMQIGLGDDLAPCAALDWSDAVPQLKNGRVIPAVASVAR